MGATASERLAKRRINELEQKLKKLQRELKDIKIEKKHIGHLRKQAERAVLLETEYHSLLDEELKETIANEQQQQQQQQQHENNNKKSSIPSNPYRCKNVDCVTAGGYYKNTGNCDVIETGSRLIIICRDCGSRYTLPIRTTDTNHKVVSSST